ncbi:2'-5' RNA ligase family protein [Uliginosibacterium sp. H3]|uniref:RNA 2',3'-cyclic phosphodiesterase n=1 Tax=Uliginosibacterium silvisoli TaxID=3114758 RepID=A0ABU6K4N3_9RHOO|nr:2'-5' RNA ligase family protein [Uliginosibacterium sp. H3]
MSAQLSLGGFEPAVFTDSFFFALQPNAETASRIAELTRRLRAERGIKGIPIPAERLHVTLTFLGAFSGVPQSVVSSAVTTGDALKAAPFEVRFDRVQKFGHDKRALVLRSSEDLAALNDFQSDLVRAMRLKGLKPAGPAGFTPHLTLLYEDAVMLDESIEPVIWTAREFVLVRSLIGQSRYEVLGRWPLQA